MIDQDMRNTVMRFSEDGMSLRKIGCILKISRSSNYYRLKPVGCNCPRDARILNLDSDLFAALQPCPMHLSQ